MIEITDFIEYVVTVRSNAIGLTSVDYDPLPEKGSIPLAFDDAVFRWVRKFQSPEDSC